MVLGLFVVFVVYAIAVFLKLAALTTVLKTLIFYVPFAIIVLFSHELRRALAAFGRTPFFALFSGYHAEETISEIVLAVTSLVDPARRRAHRARAPGGPEDLHRKRRRAIDSAVSYDLLVTLFAPGTPLHDGAVIVSGERIAAASCFLPLSLKESLSKRFGTRHRAAIGITEETDALAIVVSEERGTISVARDGELLDELDAQGPAGPALARVRGAVGR